VTRIPIACSVASVTLLTLALAAWGEPAPCVVSATAPEQAFVGEQIVLQLRTLRRPDVSAATWIDGPAFPGFRSDPLQAISGETRVHEQGAAYLVFEERRALFAIRAGRLEIPAARLRCMLHTLPGQPPRDFVATLAPRVVEALMPPAQGRPEGWSGLVGSVRITVHAEPRSIALGQSLRVEVSIEGDADLRDAPLPFGGAREIGGAEVFAARPLLRLDPGERLRIQRLHSLELVPHEAGILTLPELRIPFFDPRSRRYKVAVSAPVEIRVDPPEGG